MQLKTIAGYISIGVGGVVLASLYNLYKVAATINSLFDLQRFINATGDHIAVLSAAIAVECIIVGVTLLRK